MNVYLIPDEPLGRIKDGLEMIDREERARILFAIESGNRADLDQLKRADSLSAAYGERATQTGTRAKGRSLTRSSRESDHKIPATLVKNSRFRTA